uniref:Uncharacterized protein n=1 Tax=Arundo donax TaxID=35708 RepID=A0A0A8Z4W0_ARUDO
MINSLVWSEAVCSIDIKISCFKVL